ncbi:MAG: hypothetical protein HGA67_01350 [Candidatus Yonathbacteria bacterium]|nr:hypothetical protein [Candidatus Yonathbacteria bacterium]
MKEWLQFLIPAFFFLGTLTLILLGGRRKKPKKKNTTPSTQTKTKWWDVRSLKGKFLPGSPMWTEWIRIRSKIMLMIQALFTLCLLVRAGSQILPQVSDRLAGKALPVGVLLCLLIFLGAAKKVSIYHHSTGQKTQYYVEGLFSKIIYLLAAVMLLGIIWGVWML